MGDTGSGSGGGGERFTGSEHPAKKKTHITITAVKPRYVKDILKVIIVSSKY
jgi:hypothetical protein